MYKMRYILLKNCKSRPALGQRGALGGRLSSISWPSQTKIL